jgi:acyl-CoA thioesterase
MTGADAGTALARQCAEAMWRDDAASQGLGMALLDVGPGRAVLRMAVTAAMCNGHGTCHGGFIFALADSAFAFACNTGNERTVAARCDVTFLRPVQAGQVLVADAREVARWGRNGLYDVTVRDETGRDETGRDETGRNGDTTIAEFRGHSRGLGSPILPTGEP